MYEPRPRSLSRTEGLRPSGTRVCVGSNIHPCRHLHNPRVGTRTEETGLLPSSRPTSQSFLKDSDLTLRFHPNASVLSRGLVLRHTRFGPPPSYTRVSPVVGKMSGQVKVIGVGRHPHPLSDRRRPGWTVTHGTDARWKGEPVTPKEPCRPGVNLSGQRTGRHRRRRRAS